jgi:hypothetical protein
MVTALASAAGPAASDPILYDVFIVEAFNPEYDLREVYFADLNDLNIGVGTSTEGSYYAGFWWDIDSDKSIIPIFPKGLNNLGQAVAGATIYDIGTGGTVSIPSVPGSYPSPRAVDTNDQGVVVGYGRNQQSDSNKVNRTAFVYDPVGGTRTTGIPAARELLRINENNVAVGNIRPSASADRGLVYYVDTGDWVNLSDLLPGTWSTATDISERDVVCGEGTDGVSISAFIWSEATGFTFLPGLDGGETMRVHPAGIDSEDRVVGSALNGESDWCAFIWDEATGMRDLNDLAPVPGTYLLDRASMINENGWIVGYAHEGPGWSTSRGFVLRPVDGSTVGVPAGAGGEEAGFFPLRLAPGSTNPFRSRVTLEAEVTRAGHVQVIVHDVSGREIASLLDRPVVAGRYPISWDGRADDGAMVSPGVYFARLDSPDGIVVKRLVLTR